MQALHINPFALVAAGSVLILLLTLHIIRRTIYPPGPPASRITARIVDEERPVLVDVYVQGPGLRDTEEWTWENITPLGAKLLADSASNRLCIPRCRPFVPLPPPPPPPSPRAPPPYASPRIEVTVTIAMPSLPTKHRYDSDDDRGQWDYALGIAKIPWCETEATDPWTSARETR